MMIADTLVILDNLFGRAIVVANVEVPPRAGPAERLRLYDAAEQRLDDLVGRLGQRHGAPPPPPRDNPPPPRPPSPHPPPPVRARRAPPAREHPPGGPVPHPASA